MALAAALPLAIALATAWLESPPTVDEITIDNPTPFDIMVAVSDGRGGGWMHLATVDHDATRTVELVIDQGATWRFRFVAQTESGGEVTVERSRLAADGWRVAVPTTVEQALRAAGAPPSPP